jgi:hypothetical protein
MEKQEKREMKRNEMKQKRVAPERQSVSNQIKKLPKKHQNP